MKPTTYYIQGRNGVCVKANNIKELNDYCLPCETVKMHLKLQRMKMMENSNYRPQPIVFNVEKAKLRSLLHEVKRKVKHLPVEDCIALQLQSNNIPVILLISKQ
jgi:hypothetical protein